MDVVLVLEFASPWLTPWEKERVAFPAPCLVINDGLGK